MIFTDIEIQIALKAGHLIIAPNPPEEAYSSTSVDLTLGKRFGRWNAKPGMPIRPGDPQYTYKQLDDIRKEQDIGPSGITLNPRDFVLAWTAEEVELPITSRIAARVEGKSSLARLGLGIHVTAPTIHAGFKGEIQLEIFNFGPHQLILDVGMKICQLIFEQTIGTPGKAYAGQFKGQHSG